MSTEDVPTPPYPITLPPEEENLPFMELPFSKQRKILGILARNARRSSIINTLLDNQPPTPPPPPPYLPPD